MSWVSFVIIVIVFFMPPLNLVSRFNSGFIAQVGLFSLLLISWLFLWFAIWVIVRLIRSETIKYAFGRLIEISQPRIITGLFLVVCIIILVLSMGGLAIVNLVLETNFHLIPGTVTLALFGIVAEFVRKIESNSWQEQMWRQMNEERRSGSL